jgi:hypothetical protein
VYGVSLHRWVPLTWDSPPWGISDYGGFPFTRDPPLRWNPLRCTSRSSLCKGFSFTRGFRLSYGFVYIGVSFIVALSLQRFPCTYEQTYLCTGLPFVRGVPLQGPRGFQVPTGKGLPLRVGFQSWLVPFCKRLPFTRGLPPPWTFLYEWFPLMQGFGS